MSEAANSKLSAAAGGLFPIAGVAFAVAALLGDQPVFYGAAAAFVAYYEWYRYNASETNSGSFWRGWPIHDTFVFVGVMYGLQWRASHQP